MRNALIKGALQRANGIKKEEKTREGESLRSLEKEEEKKPDLSSYSTTLGLLDISLSLSLSFDPFISFFFSF